MTTGASSLSRMLRLDPTGPDEFCSTTPMRLAGATVRAEGAPEAAQLQRVYGGQLVAQALAAAIRTVGDRQVHSLHAYFVSGALADMPLRFAVRRLRDGRSFSYRSVEAAQGNRLIVTVSAAFHDAAPESVPEHQDPAPDASDPDDLPPATGGETFEHSGIDARFVPRADFDPDSSHMATRRVWIRLTEVLPSDGGPHACGIAYLSDSNLIGTALAPYRELIDNRGMTLASLDHSIWFHRPARADDWLLYAMVSPSGAGSRALAMGHLYTRDGGLVATVAQQGMLRLGELDQP